MSTPYVGGTITAANAPFGGLNVTIGGVIYQVEGDYKPTRPTRKIRRNDVNGDQKDVEFRAEPSTLQIKLQLAVSTTTVPFNGVTWSGPDGTGGVGATVAWVIHDTSDSYPQGEFWYVDVTCESVALATS